eukprot:TRINITY_DN8794_c0_g1_i1.p1 TRINITY_DN8794_c0_g1~~TRINITY_DN8794_c0_g1_i1.p1  ORF type:complete len:225 (-),score=51.75 TRINITY_DN8794_c0_g1_i1:108-782(-)
MEAQQRLTIEQVVAANPYNPEILPDLERYVQQQVASGTYNLDANLTLLRLYQIEPQRVNLKIMALICIKAMMALPRMDFTLCQYLISERIQTEDPTFVTLTNLGHFLEAGRFAEFWDEAARHRELLKAVPGFEAAIQRFALHLLGITYQRVPRKIVAEAVNIDGPLLDKFLEQQVATAGWALVPETNAQVIELPANEDNTLALRRNEADSIPLDHVSRLFPVLS